WGSRPTPHNPRSQPSPAALDALDRASGAGNAPGPVMRLLSIVAFSTFALAGCASQKSSSHSAAPHKVEQKEAVPGGQSGATDDMRTSDIDNDGKPEVYKYYTRMDDPERP